MDIISWLADLMGQQTEDGAAKTLNVPEWLVERAALMAEEHGHLLGPMAAGAQEGEIVGSCRRCGALAIVSVRPERAGIRGTACSHSCRTRQAIRSIHRLEVQPDRFGTW
jgi:hypothetical protein